MKNGIIILSNIVACIATIVIASATLLYAKISKRTLNGMKVYLKLMLKQATIMRANLTSMNTHLTEKDKENILRQHSSIDADILKEIENI